MQAEYVTGYAAEVRGDLLDGNPADVHREVVQEVVEDSDLIPLAGSHPTFCHPPVLRNDLVAVDDLDVGTRRVLNGHSCSIEQEHVGAIWNVRRLAAKGIFDRSLDCLSRVQPRSFHHPLYDGR